MASKLVIVATPIGNLGDLSPRATTELKEADFWIVEDTRVSGKLQSFLGEKCPMKVLSDASPPLKVKVLVDQIQNAEKVCLISDAGTPVISDPGAELISLCREAGIEIDSIPGPSAVATALTLTGFYAQRYAFLGFLSKKNKLIIEALEPFVDSPLTLVLFESQYRIEATLDLCHLVLGKRKYAICRELTKLHQQVYVATLPEIPSIKEVPRKGEFTIVIEGRRRIKDN